MSLTKPRGKEYPPGAVWDGENYVIPGRVLRIPYESQSTAEQAIPTGALNEVPVKFGVVTGDSALDIDANGIFTVKRSLPGFEGSLDLNLDNTGGVSILSLWTEVSLDGGSTYIAFNNSLKIQEFPNAAQGYQRYGIASNSTIPVNAKFRVMALNIGAGTLLLKPTLQAIAAGGNVTGFSARITVG